MIFSVTMLLYLKTLRSISVIMKTLYKTILCGILCLKLCSYGPYNVTQNKTLQTIA